jgi:two-component system alkaline phosphatase synthesis response regulator PhoP
VSKVKALLRRIPIGNNKNILSFGHLIINKESYQVSVHGTSIDFPKKEFELLALLASDAERIFNRNEILENVWGNDVVVGERTIDVHIRKIREKIGDDFVATIKGVGYRFISP